MTTRDRPTGQRRTRRRAGSSRGSLDDDGAPRSLSEEVAAQAQTEAEDNAAPLPAQTEQDLDFTPQSRLREVGERGGGYDREYRLQLLHRLLMRRIPLDQIADQLGVSVQTVYRNRQDLYKRLRAAAKQLDIHDFIGDTLGFYNEVTAMALRGASSGKAPLNIRLAALRTALASKDHMVKFLSEAGVMDALKYMPDKNEDKGDLERIVEMTENLLKTDMEGESGIELPEGDTGLDDDLEDIHLI